MSKKPFDFLVHEREPLVYVEKALVRMVDGFLTLLQGQEGKSTIAPSSHLVLMLGAGTSISQEAAIFCATNDLHIAFARGGCNVHSYFMAGRYQDPQSLVNQVQLAQNHKLEIARWLLEYRLRRHGYLNALDEVRAMQDIQSLIAWEGRWIKALYAKHALASNTVFSRNFDAEDAVNAKLNVLNNALYSVCTALCLCLGLSPSIGFIHGTTRRGGLAFDFADILKADCVTPIAFNAKVEGSKNAMYKLAGALRENHSERVKTLLALGGFIARGEVRALEEYCCAHRSY